MKIILLVVITFICTAVVAQDITPYINGINKEEIKSQVYTLASPEMMGRDTGEPGQKAAAKYISDFYREHDLDSLQYKGYQQPFNLYTFNRGDVQFSYDYYNEKRDTTVHKEFNFAWLATGNIVVNDTLPTEYLGYGTTPVDNDLSNRVVMLLPNKSVAETNNAIRSLRDKNNARIFIICSAFSDWGGSIPSQEELVNAKENNKFIKAIHRSEGKYLMNGAKREEAFSNMIDLLPKDVLIQFMPKWYFSKFMGVRYKDLQKSEKKRIKGKEHAVYVPKVKEVMCSVTAHLPQRELVDTENVVAFVEGTDLKEEVIVITGHYDHIGAKNDTTINYGADDNASGTVGVMQIAATLQKAAKDGIRPRRSVMCVAFSGEEIGLRGSHYFVNNCPVDLESVILNINMDMIGRNSGKKASRSKTVYLINKGKNDGYVKRTSKKIAKQNDNLIVSTHPGLKEKLMWTFSSDHFRFRRKGIPIACLFTGLHADYHTPRDTPDKINYDKLTEICKLGTEMVWNIANSDKKLTVKRKEKKIGFIEKMLD